MTRPDERGFTLLELTIALLLLALMAAVLMGSLRLAGRGVEGGEAKMARMGEMRQTQEFLREALTSQYPQRMKKMPEFPILFGGTSDELRYAAPLPARVIDGGIYYFRLVVTKDSEHSRLVLERLIPDVSAAAMPEFSGNEDKSILAEDIGEIKIEYFGRDPKALVANPPTWHDRWEDLQRLPLLIKIDVKPTSGPEWPTLYVAPRRAPEAGCTSWDAGRQTCVGIV